MPFVQISYDDLYFDPKVQEMCVAKSFTCPYYKHSWSCPPAAPYLENQIAKYDEYYLIYSRFDLEQYIKQEKKKNPKRSELFIKSNFFYNTMDSTDLDKEFEAFLDQYEKPYSEKLFLYSGTCTYCKEQDKGECTYDTGKPCRFHEQRQYSMEAVGIEVVRTVLNLNLSIDYPSTKYSYKFGLACFKK